MNTPLSLSRFQDSFAQLLQAPPGEAADAQDSPHALHPLHALASQPGFAVYRNTVRKGCIDALQANYPAVLRLVGEAWFRAVAALYVQAQPPRDARLLGYGAAFPDFLHHFAPAAELPYLSSVARLDRCWTEAHSAADAAPLAPEALTPLAPEPLGTLVLTPHPATRWAWFDGQPIYTLWQRNRPAPGAAHSSESRREDDTQNSENVDDSNDGALDWRSEGALLTRPAGTVIWHPLDAGGCAFLDACAAARPLAQAADEALARQPDTDLSALMALLLRAGALCSAAA